MIRPCIDWAYQQVFDSLYHAIHVAAFIEKAKLLCKGELAHNIEGIELDPFTQIDNLGPICKVVKL